MRTSCVLGALVLFRFFIFFITPGLNDDLIIDFFVDMFGVFPPHDKW